VPHDEPRSSSVAAQDVAKLLAARAAALEAVKLPKALTAEQRLWAEDAVLEAAGILRECQARLVRQRAAVED
jgi:hypothetical protein